MADTVIVGCFFTILLINACNGGFGLPGLVAQDENSTHSSGTDAQLVEDKDSVQKMMVARYKCHQCEWQECLMGEVTLCTEALFCYKSSVRDSDGELRYSRGCSVASDHAQFTCRHKTPQGLSKRHAGQVNVVCCAGDLCNAGSFPPLAQEPGGGGGGGGARGAGGAWRLAAGLAGAALALAALAAAAVLLLRNTHRLRVSQAALHKLGADSNYFSSNVYTPQVTCAFYEGLEGSQNGVRATAAGDSTLREYLQGSLSSGSGSGLPLMVQRTLSKQVTLLECVGKGRYGSVWRGLWCADSVAVKIFFSRDEASWRRETEIYSTVLLRHSNILAYVGSDMTSRNSCTQLWLITHFHPLGSLYEHLGRTTLTRQQMMVMSLSIVNGLLHLHTDIHGTQGKPAIAHRDIKSKNILVKVNGECCIADFGLAMTAAHAACAQPGAPQGTTRYMSPELLDQSMNINCLEAWRRCDMYALALVLWELTRRVAPAREARAPFAELTPADPSRDLMRKLVAVHAARPTMPTHTHPVTVVQHEHQLVLWELTPADPSRDLMRKLVAVHAARPTMPTHTHPVTVVQHEHQLVLWELTPADPSRDLMRKLVAVHAARPTMPTHTHPVTVVQHEHQLVLWELTPADPSRDLMRKLVAVHAARPTMPTHTHPVTVVQHEHQLVLWELTPADPSRDLMRKLVAVHAARPTMPTHTHPVTVVQHEHQLVLWELTPADPSRDLMRKLVAVHAARPTMPTHTHPVTVVQHEHQLVLWELTPADPSRDLMRKLVAVHAARPTMPTHTHPVTVVQHEHQLVLWELTPADPSRDLMRKLVAVHAARPTMPTHTHPVTVVQHEHQLVLWELTPADPSRDLMRKLVAVHAARPTMPTHTHPVTVVQHEHQLVLWELTPADPSRDLMRKLVAVHAARPTMPTHTHPVTVVQHEHQLVLWELTPADPSRDLMRKLVAVHAARPTMPTHTHPVTVVQHEHQLVLWELTR